MKYFTQYLPDLGNFKDLKIGEKIFAFGDLGEGPPVLLEWTGNELGTCRAKLFLCSRDIQVGDKYHKLRGSKLLTAEAGGYIPIDMSIGHEEIFKVIGEVSPEATWVKEGMEFDEYNCISKKGDVKFIGISIKNGSLVRTLITENQYLKAQSEYTLGSHAFLKIEIKDPCGHFH